MDNKIKLPNPALELVNAAKLTSAAAPTAKIVLLDNNVVTASSVDPSDVGSKDKKIGTI